MLAFVTTEHVEGLLVPDGKHFTRIIVALILERFVLMIFSPKSAIQMLHEKI